MWRKIAAKFNDTSRKGWKELINAGYVEERKYELSAKNKAGYFCSTCEYVKNDENAKFSTVCTKLNNAEDAPWGCCNYWEPIEHDESYNEK
jgi:hypothetical protein